MTASDTRNDVMYLLLQLVYCSLMFEYQIVLFELTVS